ncbi:2,4-dienoyl-CoA reductase [Vibrio ishigakensis]|uniref:2,4-dienoyl-CoA reductase n=1 Tax=Vibrio ishigakensis TaxID=1481914 RepID=A0A0B8P479_9VIBR|nr:2,4-dienoyl-CoA reductase [Vibrio ishigakensis]
MQKRGVHLLSGVSYEKIDKLGLHVTVEGAKEVLDVDSVVICAGQVSVRPFESHWEGRPVHVIGGADEAGELDAVRAIRQGFEIATQI